MIKRCILSGHELVKPGSLGQAHGRTSRAGRPLLNIRHLFHLSRRSIRERLSPRSEWVPEDQHPAVEARLAPDRGAQRGSWRWAEGERITTCPGWQRAPAPAADGPPAQALASDRSIGNQVRDPRAADPLLARLPGPRLGSSSGPGRSSISEAGTNWRAAGIRPP